MTIPVFPDEILAMIAKATVDGREIKVYAKDSIHIYRRYGCRIRVKGFPRTNILLVNKLFYNEAWSGMRESFDGKLQVAERTLEKLLRPRIWTPEMSMTYGLYWHSITWMVPLLKELEIIVQGHKDQYDQYGKEYKLPRIVFLQDFPNLRLITVNACANLYEHDTNVTVQEIQDDNRNVRSHLRLASNQVFRRFVTLGLPGDSGVIDVNAKLSLKARMANEDGEQLYVCDRWNVTDITGNNRPKLLERLVSSSPLWNLREEDLNLWFP